MCTSMCVLGLVFVSGAWRRALSVIVCVESVVCVCCVLGGVYARVNVIGVSVFL